MKTKHILVLIYSICIIGSTFTAMGINIDPSNQDILYTGRFEFTNPSKPVVSHVTSSIKVNFYGTGIAAIFSSEGTSYLYIIIDDNADPSDRLILEIGAAQQTFSLASGLTDGLHQVEIVKTNQYDTKVTFHGFEIDGSGLGLKPERPLLALEVYGDSNPAGHSAWDIDDGGAVRDNGGYFTYPAITARMLNAECSNISGGGSGVTDQGPWNLVTYHHLYHMNDHASGTNIWDFYSNYWSFSPNAVVINLGANDYYRSVSKALIKSGWKNFISNDLRSYYPDAHIVLANSYGWAINEPADYVHEAIEELRDGGDNNVSYVRFPWLWSQQHAVIWEHAGFANILAEHLANELDLPQPMPNELSSFAPYGQLSNGSFEKTAIPGVANGWRTSGTAHIVSDSTGAFDGKKYLHLISNARAHYANDAAPGDTFTVSAWMRATSGDQGRLKIEFKNQAQNIISSATIDGIKTLTSDWQLYTTVGVAPANTWQINVVLHAVPGSIVDYDALQMVNGSIVNLDPEKNLVREYKLFQNYPNPFNPFTEIKFHIPKPGIVTLEVYNLLGEKVSTLLEKHMNKGTHKATFGGKELAAGVYFYQIQCDDFLQTRKCVILK